MHCGGPGGTLDRRLKGEEEGCSYHFGLVMPAAKRDLSDALSHSRFAGRDRAQVLAMAGRPPPVAVEARPVGGAPRERGGVDSGVPADRRLLVLGDWPAALRCWLAGRCALGGLQLGAQLGG